MRTKFIVSFFMVAIAMTMMNTNVSGQKSGILKKDHYGAFTGDDWEDFLAGSRSGDFEPKANVKLATYITVVERFAKEVLGEASLKAAIENSTVVTFPTDAKIVTANTAGEWITRDAYPGEKGYLHTGTKKLWLSFSCGNLVNVAIKDKKIPEGSYTGTGTAAVDDQTKKLLFALGDSKITNLLISDGQKANNGFSYADYSMGRNDRQNDFVVDAALFTMIQNNKECCNNTPAAPVVAPNMGYSYNGGMMVVGSQPSGVILTANQQQDKLKWHETAAGKFGINLAANIAGQWIYDKIDDHRNNRCNGLCGNGNFTGGGTIYAGGVFHGASPGLNISSGITPSYALIPGAGGNGNGFGNLLGNQLGN